LGNMIAVDASVTNHEADIGNFVLFPDASDFGCAFNSYRSETDKTESDNIICWMSQKLPGDECHDILRFRR
jgi:hypothetical protein